jgi:hypothetical protein
MYWRDVQDDSAGGSWLGLELVVEPRRGVPGFRVEAGGGRSIRLMAGGWPIFWARIADDFWGYWYLRAEVAARSPGLVVPPIDAAEARSIAAESGSAAWFADWARWFARKLDASVMTPLYPGRCWLAPCPSKLLSMMPRPRRAPAIPSAHVWEGALEQTAHGFLDWDIGDVLLPLTLRTPAPEDDGRLKAWRKMARDGKLPPILLMWISGLQRYVVLDGHDRLQAALLEGVTPQALGLLGFREEPVMLTDAGKVQTEAIAALVAANPNPRGGRPHTTDSVNRLLLEAYDDRPRLSLVTRAWPLSGGIASWTKQVRARLAKVSDADVDMLA